MKRKRVNQEPRRTLLVVTASEAEALYLSQMRKDCRYTNMTVRWAKDIIHVEDLISAAAKMRTTGKYDSTWCLFGSEAMHAGVDHLKLAEEFGERRKIKVAWNVPGLPLWFLLHLMKKESLTNSPVLDSRQIGDALKGPFKAFEDSSAYLLNEGASLHLKLFPAKASAVVNAGVYNEAVLKKLGGMPATTMPKLLAEITDFCGLADISHNQKLIGLKNS